MQRKISVFLSIIFGLGVIVSYICLSYIVTGMDYFGKEIDPVGSQLTVNLLGILLFLFPIAYWMNMHFFHRDYALKRQKVQLLDVFVKASFLVITIRELFVLPFQGFIIYYMGLIGMIGAIVFSVFFKIKPIEDRDWNQRIEKIGRND